MSQNTNIKIHNRLSKKYPIKNYHLYTKNKYNKKNTFNYPFFKNKKINSFKHLILKNNNQSYQYSFFSKTFTQSLLKPLNLNIQYNTPIILFINNKYFKIHNIHNQFNINYLKNHYSINNYKSTILTRHTYLKNRSHISQTHYQTLYTYTNLNNLNKTKHFNHIKHQIDINNYINYIITEIYFGNIN